MINRCTYLFTFTTDNRKPSPISCMGTQLVKKCPKALHKIQQRLVMYTKTEPVYDVII